MKWTLIDVLIKIWNGTPINLCLNKELDSFLSAADGSFWPLVNVYKFKSISPPDIKDKWNSLMDMISKLLR